MKIKIKKEDIQALLFFIIGLSLLIYSLLEHYALGISWEISPYLFPLLISIFLSVLAALLFFQTIRNTIKPAEIDEFNLDENLEIGREITDKDKSKTNKKRFFLVLFLSILYYFLIGYLGFMISTAVFLASLFFILGERRWWMILIVSIVSTLLFEGIFLKLLNVILP